MIYYIQENFKRNRVTTEASLFLQDPFLAPYETSAFIPLETERFSTSRFRYGCRAIRRWVDGPAPDQRLKSEFQIRFTELASNDSVLIDLWLFPASYPNAGFAYESRGIVADHAQIFIDENPGHGLVADRFNSARGNHAASHEQDDFQDRRGSVGAE
jgi:hypothetical protein